MRFSNCSGLCVGSGFWMFCTGFWLSATEKWAFCSCRNVLGDCGGQHRFGIPFWRIGEFTTHFRTYFSGWTESNAHWGVTGILDFDPWPGEPKPVVSLGPSFVSIAVLRHAWLGLLPRPQAGLGRQRGRDPRWTWLWVKIKPGYGPQILVHVSSYQGKPFWVPIFDPQPPGVISF